MRNVLAAVSLLAVGLGSGLTFAREPRAEAPPIKDAPRQDRYGDPLPLGAVARLGTIRFRSPNEVHSLALSPDGKIIAAASRGGLTFFDAADGKRIQHLPASGPAGQWEDLLVFSPDGKRLAGRKRVRVGEGARDVVRVWESDQGWKPHDCDADKAIWVGWSASGELLAVCLETGAVRLDHLGTGRSRRFVCDDLPMRERYRDAICACSIQGRTLAVVDQRQHIHVWDTASGGKRCTLQPGGGHVFAVAVSPDGGRLVASPGHALKLWDLTTGQLRFTGGESKEGGYGCLLFSPDGKRFAALENRTVIFRDAATGQERGRTRNPYVLGPSPTFSADGKTLIAVQGWSGIIHRFEVASGEQKPEPVGHACWGHAVFSADGRRVATGGSTDGTIHVWDPRTSKSLATIERPLEWVRTVAFSADGRSLFSSWADDQLWVSDAATGKGQYVLRLADPERPNTRQSGLEMHLSADGRTLVAFSHYQPKNFRAGPWYGETLITGWDPATRMQLFRRRRPGLEPWWAIAPDGRVLVGAYSEDPRAGLIHGSGPMHLENLATGERLLTFPALEGQSWPGALSPDGRLLVFSHDDLKPRGPEPPPGGWPITLRVWEVASAGEVLALPSMLNHRAAVSSNSRLLAIAAPGRDIVLWDLTRGREWRRFKGLDAEVGSLTFSPDGRRLISGHADATFLVWEVGTYPSPATEPGAEAIASAWTDLAGRDAARALRARWLLAAAPQETMALLKERLRPARPADKELLRRLLADLEIDRFAVRDRAQADLEALADLAEPTLRRALANKPTLEQSRRVRQLLDRLRLPVTRPELLRSLRALAVLEDLGTPAARQLLEDLAAGTPQARLTREAKASLSRLQSRRPAGS
jgi:WD40 repeat protein